MAASAGLIAGDVITSFGGRAVTTSKSLTTILSRYPQAQSASLTWVGLGGGVHTAWVMLTPGPAQ